MLAQHTPAAVLVRISSSTRSWTRFAWSDWNFFGGWRTAKRLPVALKVVGMTSTRACALRPETVRRAFNDLLTYAATCVFGWFVPLERLILLAHMDLFELFALRVVQYHCSLKWYHPVPCQILHALLHKTSTTQFSNRLYSRKKQVEYHTNNQACLEVH